MMVINKMRKEEVILTAQTIKLSENLNKLNKMHIETDEMILDIDGQIDEMSELIKNIEGNIDFENLNFNFELNNLQEIKTPINLEELISEEEKNEIKEKIEKKYSNLTSFEEIYYDDFEKLFENSKSYLEKNNINPTGNLFLEIMNSEEILINYKNYNEKYERLKWNKYDYTICFFSAILGSIFDNLIKVSVGGKNATSLVKKAGYSFSKDGAETDLQKKVANLLTKLEKTAKVSFDPSLNHHLKLEQDIQDLLNTKKDLSIEGLHPSIHRLLSPGHDMLRIVTAVKDVMNGTFTAIGTDGKLKVIDRLHPDYLGEDNYLIALLKVLAHWITDIGTSAGLPIPGSTYFLKNVSKTNMGVGQKENLKVNEIVIEMYKNGYDLRHLVSSSMVPISAEIIIRGSYFLMNYEDISQGIKKEQHKLKMTELLTLSHSLISSQNLLKTFITKDVLKLNLAEILVLIKTFKNLIKNNKELNNKFNSDFKNSIDKLKQENF